MGICGIAADGSMAIPTLWAELGATRPGTPVSLGADVTLPIWAQLLTMIGNLRNLETVAKDNLVAAINEVLSTGSNGGNVDQSGGMSTEAANLLITILENAVYTSNQTGNISALAEALGVAQTVELTSITATYSGGDVAVGTAVSDLTGISVTANYSDGSAATVKNYVLSGEINEGNNVITVSWGGMTTAFTVMGVREEEEVTLSGITATYSGGDVLEGTALTDLTGIVVIASYSDGTTENVTDYTLSGEIAVGSNIITVSYGGKTTTITVTGYAEAVADDITVENGVMTIISVGSEITVSDGVMTIA